MKIHVSHENIHFEIMGVTLQDENFTRWLNHVVFVEIMIASDTYLFLYNYSMSAFH